MSFTLCAVIRIVSLFMLVASPVVAAAAPAVVVSIKPIHSLVAGVMASVGEPKLLIAGGASPHAYALRPSDAQALQEADAVFWIGRELETVLIKPLRALPRNTTVVALHEAPGVRLLPFRESGRRDGPERADPADADTHGHGQVDMHIWLDPQNVRAMVAAIIDTLARLDGSNAERYRANGAALVDRLGALDAELIETLAPIKDRPYIAFHDAYQYLEARYGLSPAGSITINPDRRPGAKRLAEIRRAIVETGAVCVFAEPQFEPALVATVTEGTPAKTATLDPLGADMPPGPDAYFDLMHDLATALGDCLLPPR